MPDPAARALRAGTAVTPRRKAPLRGSGLGTCFQARPFQCRITGRGVLKFPVQPTARACRAELAATPVSVTGLVMPGGRVSRHRVPFHTAMAPLTGPAPTARASRGDTTAMLVKSPGTDR
jgi:hypothetical protein